MIVTRYLLKEIMATLIIIVVALLLILVTNQFIRYLNTAAAGGITVMTVVKLMLLQVPLFLGYILPVGMFLAVLLTLGQLYVNQEMTVLFACGYSQVQLLRLVMIIAVPVMILTAWLLFDVQPTIERYRIKISRDAVSGFSVDKLFPKRFQNVLRSGWVLYADSESSEGLKDVFLAKHYPATRDYPGGYWEIVKSDLLHQVSDEKNSEQFAHLGKGVGYRGEPGMNNYRMVKFDQSALELEPAPIVTNEKMQASFLPMLDLWRNYQQNRVTQVEFNWRLSVPFSVLILAMLAVPLSYLTPRQGRYAKVFYALLFYLFYTNMMFVSRSWAFSEKMGPILGLWWIHGLMLLVALGFLLYRGGYERMVALLFSAWQRNRLV